MEMRDLQTILRKADVKALEQYLEHARGGPADPDVRDITEAIIELGLTPYLAAKHVHAQSSSGRTFETLKYKARVIAEEMFFHFGGITVEKLLRELSMSGEVEVPTVLQRSFKQGCREMGYTVREKLVFELQENDGRRSHGIEKKLVQERGRQNNAGPGQGSESMAGGQDSASGPGQD